MLSAYKWTEPHYRDAAARYLGAALAALEATSKRLGDVSFAEAVGDSAKARSRASSEAGARDWP